LTQTLSKVQDLTGQLAEQEARYSNEVSGLKRLVDMMEEREKQAKEIVESVEREWATVGEKAERREAALKDEAEREVKARLEAERRLEQLEAVLDKMGRGELPIPGRSTPSTPFRGSGLADSTVDAMIGLSPTVAMASRVQRSGKTFTEVYADYVQLQEEYAKKCAEYDHMDRTLSSVLAQIEERVGFLLCYSFNFTNQMLQAPILSQQRIEYERLQVEAAQLGSQLSQALSERDTQHNNTQELSQKLAKSTNENKLLQRQLEDLGLQVQIFCVKLRDAMTQRYLQTKNWRKSRGSYHGCRDSCNKSSGLVQKHR
jgi:nucleoprotein TPR